MGGKERKIAVAQIGGELDWRRESAIERDDGALGKTGEHEALLGLGERKDAVRELAAVGERNLPFLSVGTQKADRDRDRHRLLDGLPRRWRHGLADFNRRGRASGM